MKILLIHNNYQFRGGEDSVFDQEYSLLKVNNNVEKLVFQNEKGWKGILSFLLSIWNIFTAAKIKKKIKSFQPDIIHLHNWHYAIGPLSIRVIKKNKIPLVTTLHNFRLICPSSMLLYKGEIYTKSINVNFPWEAVKKKVYRDSMIQTFWLAFIIWFHKKINTWDKTDKYIVLTEFAKQIFINSHLKIQSDKFIIKPNFFDLEITPEKDTSDTFLFIGRLSEEKGIKLLLDAFENSKYIINIAGDGPLKEMVINASIHYENINYLGTLSKQLIIKELKKSTALICPSICYEGMPMNIIEAFSCRTPVIASNLGAMRFMVEHKKNGLLFEAGNTKDLISKIEKWHNKSEDEKSTYSDNAYKSYLMNYTAEENEKLLMNIYQETIKESSKS